MGWSPFAVPFQLRHAGKWLHLGHYRSWRCMWVLLLVCLMGTWAPGGGVVLGLQAIFKYFTLVFGKYQYFGNFMFIKKQHY